MIQQKYLSSLKGANQWIHLKGWFFVVLYALFAIFISSKAELVEVITNTTLLSIGMWVFSVYFVVGIIVNAISRSRLERYTMTPIATLLALAFLIVTLS